MQAADVALASIFDGGAHTVDIGQARVAHRLHRGDRDGRVEQANSQVAARQSPGDATPGTLHSQDGRSFSTMPLRDLVPAVPEVPPVAWAVGAASAPTVRDELVFQDLVYQHLICMGLNSVCAI